MYFDINKYAGKYTMHCKTKEEAMDFCKYLHGQGRKWRDSEPYSVNNTKWDVYKTKTMYYFNEGCFGTMAYAESHGYTILEWSDFTREPFTRVDPNTGDILKCVNGENAVIVLETIKHW